MKTEGIIKRILLAPVRWWSRRQEEDRPPTLEELDQIIKDMSHVTEFTKGTRPGAWHIVDKIEDAKRDPRYKPGRSAALQRMEQTALQDPDAAAAIRKLKEIFDE